MPDGTGTFAVQAHSRFLAYDMLILFQMGVAKFTHHTVGSFLRNWNCFVTYSPVTRLYILTAAEGR